MVATLSATAGCEVEIQNDLFDCRQTIHSDRTRAEIVESFLFSFHNLPPGPEPALAGCVHVYKDGPLVLHFFPLPGREEEALAALREGVGGGE